jgi:hypothetical protein
MGVVYKAEGTRLDDVFRIYKDLYSYDQADLKPTIESTDETSPFWRIQRISYAAAYGDERIVAHLFPPKNAKPPFQTVVYFLVRGIPAVDQAAGNRPE